MSEGQQKLAELVELEGLLYTIYLSCKQNLKSILRPHLPPPINSLLKAKQINYRFMSKPQHIRSSSCFPTDILYS